MKMKPVLLAAAIALVVMTPLRGQADEELFDTKAAAQHLDKGIAFLKAKNIDSAIKEFDAAAEINPDAEAYYYLGYAYYLKARTSDGENRNKSRENFERAYEIDPNFSPSRFKPTEPAPAQVPEPEQAEPPASQTTPTQPGPEEPNQPQQPVPPMDQAK
jgi:tetratricopeptide (TPR) repeat protein